MSAESFCISFGYIVYFLVFTSHEMFQLMERPNGVLTQLPWRVVLADTVLRSVREGKVDGTVKLQLLKVFMAIGCKIMK